MLRLLTTLLLGLTACGEPQKTRPPSDAGGTDMAVQQPDGSEMPAPDRKQPTAGVGTDPCLCAAEPDASSCVQMQGCAWLPDINDCWLVGELVSLTEGCAAHAAQQTCDMFPACEWTDAQCVPRGAQATPCTDHAERFECQMALGCSWSQEDEQCVAVESLVSQLFLCGVHTAQDACEEVAECFWVDTGDGDLCLDEANALRAEMCPDATDAAACSEVAGCYWEPLSTGGEGCIWTTDPTGVDGFTGIDIYGIVEGGEPAGELAEARAPVLNCLDSP